MYWSHHQVPPENRRSWWLQSSWKLYRVDWWIVTRIYKKRHVFTFGVKKLKKTVLGLLDLEDEDITFLRNAGNHAHQSTRLTSQKHRIFRKILIHMSLTCILVEEWEVNAQNSPLKHSPRWGKLVLLSLSFSLKRNFQCYGHRHAPKPNPTTSHSHILKPTSTPSRTTVFRQTLSPNFVNKSLPTLLWPPVFHYTNIITCFA
jgi:hypothetical protein